MFHIDHHSDKVFLFQSNEWARVARRHGFLRRRKPQSRGSDEISEGEAATAFRHRSDHVHSDLLVIGEVMQSSS